MNLQENIQRIKEVMGVISEESIPLQIKRRLDFSSIDEFVDKSKLVSFMSKGSAESSVRNAISFVVNKLFNKFGFDEDKYEKYSKIISDFLYKKYGSDLRKYFEKKVEDYKNREPSDTVYIFEKDYNGGGFSRPFLYFDDLVDKFGSWLDIDWDEVKNKLDGMENNQRLKIADVGDEGNAWGYNFYITKSKKN